MNLILMRHGQTELNRKGKIQGNNNSHLNSTGLSQAKSIASKISGENPKALYTSPIIRAKETAQIIGNEVGLRPKSLTGLAEHNVGLLEGLSSIEMRTKYPEFAKQWDSDPQDARPPPRCSEGYGGNRWQFSERHWHQAKDLPQAARW